MSRSQCNACTKRMAGLPAQYRRLAVFEQNPLRASDCLAIEDAPGGVEAAHAAGMKCLALTHSRPPEKLRHADWLCGSFAEVDLAKIRGAF